MKKTNAVRRIAVACEGLARRSDEIVRRAESKNGKLAELFTRKEIRITNEICCELLMSVAESSSVADLSANRANFERMRAHVMDANDALVSRAHLNPQTMSSIMNAEDTLVDLLVAPDPTVRLMAGFAKRHLGVVKSVLTSFFTDIRLQLEACDRGGSSWAHRLRGALSAPVGAIVRKGSESLFAQYGDGRCDRAAVIAFMRSLYNQKDPHLCSWPKVAGYVRNCRDESDVNFARCAEIRVQVQSWAKPEKGGIEKAWRSLTQQLKPANGRKRSSGLGPVKIPDLSWA